MFFVALEFDDLLSLFMQIYSQIFMIPLDEIQHNLQIHCVQVIYKVMILLLYPKCEHVYLKSQLLLFGHQATKSILEEPDKILIITSIVTIH